MKNWILSCRLLHKLLESAEFRKQSTLSVYLQSSMVDKRLLAYVFLNFEDVKFFSEAAWLRKTRAALVQTNAILASVK